jgi:hypothetical protein
MYLELITLHQAVVEAVAHQALVALLVTVAVVTAAQAVA